MVQCRTCGKFVLSTVEDGEKHPTTRDCPSCGASEFVDPTRR